MTIRFGERLSEAVTRYGRLCMGIDPHAYLLETWGLPVTADGAREFGLRCVEAASGNVGIVKPQIAFFERFGAAGYAALEDVLRAARAAELLTIADVKRGEIGSSMDGYAAAWLTPGSPLEADAITTNPFLGVGALDPAFHRAESTGKGVFVLAATSNSESSHIQRAQTAQGTTVSQHILEEIHNRNSSAAVAGGGLGDFGIVLGATQRLQDFGVSIETQQPVTTPVLAPGFGHQGAELSDVTHIFGELSPGVLVSESRSILSSGPSALRSAVASRAQEVRKSFV